MLARARAMTIGVVFVIACGARTELEVGVIEDASVGVDAFVEARADIADAGDASDATDASDAADAVDASPPCAFGTVVSDVFGAVVDFNGGATLPAGHYRITYVDGCMKYSGDQGWTVNAYAEGAGSDQYWLVDGNHDDIVVPPGSVGFMVGDGAYADFDACVAANVVLAPLDFDFDGGVLGVWLDDDPYTDNIAGENGRNPTWKLMCAD
jgi:hypothetical protein